MKLRNGLELLVLMIPWLDRADGAAQSSPAGMEEEAGTLQQDSAPVKIG